MLGVLATLLVFAFVGPAQVRAAPDGDATARPTPTAPPTVAPAPAAVAAPTVRTQTGAGYELTEIALPGRLLAVVAAPTPGGRRDLFLLAAPAGDPSGPRELYRLVPGTPPRLVLLRADLSRGLDALDAFDVDGDGVGEIVAGEPRQLHCLLSLRDLAPASSASTTTPLAGGGAIAEAPELAPCALAGEDWLDLRAPDPTAIRAPEAGPRVLVTAEVGRVRWFTVADGRLVPRAEEPLPMAAAREARGLRLSTPPVAIVSRGDLPSGDALPLVAVGPQAQGASRLRSLLLDPSAEGLVRRTETWSRLPGIESVQGSRCLAIDGQPALVVWTARGDKLSVFEELKLRVFRPSADRTRAGRGPSFAVETAISRWRQPEIQARDLDGDGHDDLVLIGPLGLRGKQLRVDVFRGVGGGAFRGTPSSSEIDVEAAAWSYGADFDGDRRPDLVVLAGSELRLYKGLEPGPGPGGRGCVAKKASVRVALRVEGAREVVVTVGGGGVASSEHGAADLAAVDLAGDGRVALLVPSDEDGRGVLRIVRWR